MIIPASDFFSRSAADLPPDVEDAFFSAIRNRNRTFKRTYQARFADLDAQVVRLLKGRYAKVNEVLDVGISSGATTLDLQVALQRDGYQPRITGTDLELQARLVHLGGSCSALVSGDGHPLQLSVGPLSVRPWRRRLDWVTGMWAIRPLLFEFVKRRIAEAEGGDQVLLVSPRVVNEPSITVVEDDVLALRPEFVGRFDFIRAANILNRDYFSDEQLRCAVRNLHRYLVTPGSLLLVVRSHNNGDHHGTLFEARGDGFAVVKRFGAGSEIEEIVLAS